MRQFICLDFHKESWHHSRPSRLYYVKTLNGQIYRRWAHDAIDAVESVRGPRDNPDYTVIVEYGNGLIN